MSKETWITIASAIVQTVIMIILGVKALNRANKQIQIMLEQAKPTQNQPKPERKRNGFIRRNWYFLIAFVIPILLLVWTLNRPLSHTSVFNTVICVALITIQASVLISTRFTIRLTEELFTMLLKNDEDIHSSLIDLLRKTVEALTGKPLAEKPARKAKVSRRRKSDSKNPKE